MEYINLVISHKTEIIEIYLAAVGLASVIVKLTPSLKDDTILKNIVRFVGRYIALNR